MLTSLIPRRAVRVLAHYSHRSSYYSLRSNAIPFSPARFYTTSTVPSSQPEQAPVSDRGLVDSFGRPHTYLRISLTDRCNLRCSYCMPDETPPGTPAPHQLTHAEILRMSRIFVTHGVDKIRLTGGEPLLRPDIIPIARDLAQLPVQLGITTNAVLLHRYADELWNAGVTHINISLDTLEEASFEVLTKRRGFQRVMNAIQSAIDIGFSTKLNVVVMNHVNDHELPSFVELTREQPLDVRFIEYMPFDGNRWAHPKFVSYAAMLQLVSRHYPQLQPLVTHANDTTKYYQVPGYRGRIGFITSMTDHFCAGCNRIRITADGNLKVCLFGADEMSLRDMMRETQATDEQLLCAIETALAGKHFKLGGNEDMFAIAKSDNRSMVRIGG